VFSENKNQNIFTSFKIFAFLKKILWSKEPKIDASRVAWSMHL
jgi:hypothetical protein